MAMDQSEITAHVDEQVQRTMAVHALRRIRAMIDREAADEVLKRKIATAILLVAAAILIVPVFMFCASAFR